MTNIKFSESEKSELIHFYQLELNKTLKRAEDIKGILSKCNGKPKRVRRTKAQIDAAVKPQKKITVRRHRKTSTISDKTIAVHRHHKEVKMAAITTKKRTPWLTFIPVALKHQGSPMTTREILNIAAKKFNIHDRKRGIKTLTQTLRNMSKKGLLTSETKQGERKKYYIPVS